MKFYLSSKIPSDFFVPVSRFDHGEAGKILNEVDQSGVKLVVKDGVPACVLIKPELYDALLETLEDYELYIEAERRMKNADPSDFIPGEQVFKDAGINKADLDNLPDIEIE